jgi:hypothetical protein
MAGRQRLGCWGSTPELREQSGVVVGKVAACLAHEGSKAPERQRIIFEKHQERDGQV